MQQLKKVQIRRSLLYHYHKSYPGSLFYIRYGSIFVKKYHPYHMPLAVN